MGRSIVSRIETLCINEQKFSLWLLSGSLQIKFWVYGFVIPCLQLDVVPVGIAEIKHVFLVFYLN